MKRNFSDGRKYSNGCKPKPHSNLKEDLAYIKAEINSTEKKWKKNSFNRTMRISEYFNIPPEVFSNNFIMTVIADNQVMIENYGKISDYSNEKIEINCCGKIVNICGECLKITCYTEDEVIIKGNVKSINFSCMR